MPALSNTFLFIEPQKHYLVYGSVILHKIVEENRQPQQTIVELVGDDANKEKIRQTVETLNPITFVGLGHGNVSVFSVECTEKYITVGDPEISQFTGRVVSLCSCLTAVYLGPAIMDAGAVVYTGYKTEFWFYIGDDPGTTRAVSSPFLAEFEFVASLLRGKTAGDARTDQLVKYDEEIDYWITGEGKNHADAMELSRILEMNKSNSVFLGEGSVAPSPRASVLASGITPVLIFPASLLAVGYFIYKAVQ
jgi:hypothetical protein